MPISPVSLIPPAAPIVARPSAFESARPAPSTIAPRRAGRVRPIWQSPRYLVPSVAVLLVAGFGTYYVASTVTSSRREAQDRSAREAAEQQRATAQQQRGAVDQLRATMVAARDRATRADATALAGDVMSRAQAAQAEGERFSTAGDLTAATQAYQQAAARYGEAEQLALVKREQRTAADSARAQMVAAKQRASTSAPEFARALETKNLALLQQVRPGLTSDEINRMRVANDIKRSHKVDLKVDEITVNGDEAHATGRREDDISLKEGQRIRQESRFVYTLKRGTRGWTIQETREDALKAPRGTSATDAASRATRRP